MNKTFACVSAFLAAAVAASPAAAVTPATQATANAKIYKPLTISKVQNLDFGVIVLTGSSFSGEVVSISQAGAVTCGSSPGVLLTCSGAPQAAKYHLVGTNNAVVTVSSPGASSPKRTCGSWCRSPSGTSGGGWRSSTSSRRATSA